MEAEEEQGTLLEVLPHNNKAEVEEPGGAEAGEEQGTLLEVLPRNNKAEVEEEQALPKVLPQSMNESLHHNKMTSTHMT